ncbi:hypothetical protein [Streptomyces vinaceus]|uniref:hypothetical protein n=1 Tax=Streptomyces vinaceus TaxID=1960 RepID=UPI00369DDD01
MAQLAHLKAVEEHEALGPQPDVVVAEAARAGGRPRPSNLRREGNPSFRAGLSGAGPSTSSAPPPRRARFNLTEEATRAERNLMRVWFRLQELPDPGPETEPVPAGQRDTMVRYIWERMRAGWHRQENPTGTGAAAWESLRYLREWLQELPESGPDMSGQRDRIIGYLSRRMRVGWAALAGWHRGQNPTNPQHDPTLDDAFAEYLGVLHETLATLRKLEVSLSPETEQEPLERQIHKARMGWDPKFEAWLKKEKQSQGWKPWLAGHWNQMKLAGSGAYVDPLMARYFGLDPYTPLPQSTIEADSYTPLPQPLTRGFDPVPEIPSRNAGWKYRLSWALGHMLQGTQSYWQQPIGRHDPDAHARAEEELWKTHRAERKASEETRQKQQLKETTHSPRSTPARPHTLPGEDEATTGPEPENLGISSLLSSVGKFGERSLRSHSKFAEWITRRIHEGIYSYQSPPEASPLSSGVEAAIRSPNILTAPKFSNFEEINAMTWDDFTTNFPPEEITNSLAGVRHKIYHIWPNVALSDTANLNDLASVRIHPGKKAFADESRLTDDEMLSAAKAVLKLLVTWKTSQVAAENDLINYIERAVVIDPEDADPTRKDQTNTLRDRQGRELESMTFSVAKPKNAYTNTDSQDFISYFEQNRGTRVGDSVEMPISEKHSKTAYGSAFSTQIGLDHIIYGVTNNQPYVLFFRNIAGHETVHGVHSTLGSSKASRDSSGKSKQKTVVIETKQGKYIIKASDEEHETHGSKEVMTSKHVNPKLPYETIMTDKFKKEVENPRLKLSKMINMHKRWVLSDIAKTSDPAELADLQAKLEKIERAETRDTQRAQGAEIAYNINESKMWPPDSGGRPYYTPSEWDDSRQQVLSTIPERLADTALEKTNELAKAFLAQIDKSGKFNEKKIQNWLASCDRPKRSLGSVCNILIDSADGNTKERDLRKGPVSTTSDLKSTRINIEKKFDAQVPDIDSGNALRVYGSGAEAYRPTVNQIPGKGIHTSGFGNRVLSSVDSGLDAIDAVQCAALLYREIMDPESSTSARVKLGFSCLPVVGNILSIVDAVEEGDWASAAYSALGIAAIPAGALFPPLGIGMFVLDQVWQIKEFIKTLRELEDSRKEVLRSAYTQTWEKIWKTYASDIYESMVPATDAEIDTAIETLETSYHIQLNMDADARSRPPITRQQIDRLQEVWRSLKGRTRDEKIKIVHQFILGQYETASTEEVKKMDKWAQIAIKQTNKDLDKLYFTFPVLGRAANQPAVVGRILMTKRKLAKITHDAKRSLQDYLANEKIDLGPDQDLLQRLDQRHTISTPETTSDFVATAAHSLWRRGARVVVETEGPSRWQVFVARGTQREKLATVLRFPDGYYSLTMFPQYSDLGARYVEVRVGDDPHPSHIEIDDGRHGLAYKMYEFRPSSFDPSNTQATFRVIGAEQEPRRQHTTKPAEARPATADKIIHTPSNAPLASVPSTSTTHTTPQTEAAPGYVPQISGNGKLLDEKISLMKFGRYEKKYVRFDAGSGGLVTVAVKMSSGMFSTLAEIERTGNGYTIKIPPSVNSDVTPEVSLYVSYETDNGTYSLGKLSREKGRQNSCTVPSHAHRATIRIR